MRQYIYISTAPDLTREDIDSILESCQRNNAEHGITGLLIYNGRNFLQLLEGEQSDLEWIMGRIGADHRHSGISKLEDIETNARACPNWLMHRIRLVDVVADRRKAIDAELPVSLNAHLRRIILNFAALN